jgi:hypothetical protein
MKALIASLSLTLIFPIISHLAWTQQTREPDWKPSLAYGGAPECPEHVGTRTYYSETVGLGGVRVQIIGTATRVQGKPCTYSAEIVYSGMINRKIQLPDPGKMQFTIVDFSAEGKNLLLSDERRMDPPYLAYRNVDVASVEPTNGQAHWVNAWDIFGWHEHECDATVEPQGFTEDGHLIIRARPSTWVDSGRRNCVSNVGLYETDLTSSPVRLPDDTKIPRFGKRLSEASQACKTDPDIIDVCFTVHGRLSVWNGSPGLRIWRVGTSRILGVQDDDPLPENLSKQMNWGVEAWGDFEVCPFTKERPGVMQMVCVESAEHVLFKNP